MNMMNWALIRRKLILLIIFSILACQLVECGKKKKHKAKEIVSTEEWEREVGKKDLLVPAAGKEIVPASSSPKFEGKKEESFEYASNDSDSFVSAENVSLADEESENEGDELDDELPKEKVPLATEEKEAQLAAGELPSSSSKEPETEEKKSENVDAKQSEFEINDEELIIVALDFYKNPPTEVQKKSKRTDALGLLRRDIFKKVMFRNFNGVRLPYEEIKKLQERIRKVVDEIRAGKYEEYEEKSFDFMDENKLRELFKFVNAKFKSKSLVQMQKQIFGLYIAMNNLSTEIRTSKGKKFYYKLTTAQRYHLNGFIEKLLYENLVTKTDDLLVRKTKWHSSKRLSDLPVSKGPFKEKINKTALNSLFNEIVANSTKRLRKAMHKFSALLEIVFGLYLNELGVSMSRMSKDDIDTLNSAILEIMFKDIDVNNIENKLRELIAAGYLSNPDFYKLVREGNLERPIQYFFGKYLKQENLDRREMDRKQVWYLDSVIYEILYERVDPELNLEFGSQIVKEAQNHINEAMQSANEIQNIEPQQWWWWNTPQAIVPTYYAVDPMATPMTFFDYYPAAQFPAVQQPLWPAYPQTFMPSAASHNQPFPMPTNPHQPFVLSAAAPSYQPVSQRNPQTFVPFVDALQTPFLSSSAYPALKSSVPSRIETVPQKADHGKPPDVGHSKGNILSPVPSKSYAQILKDSKPTMGPSATTIIHEQRESSEKGKQILEMIKPKELKPSKIVWADIAEKEDEKEKNKGEGKMKSSASSESEKVAKIQNKKQMDYSSVSILKRPSEQQPVKAKTLETMPFKAVEPKSSFAQKLNKMSSGQTKPKEKPVSAPPTSPHSDAKSEDRNKEANSNILPAACRFVPGSFRPGVVSSQGGKWVVSSRGRFVPGSFRPKVVSSQGGKLVVSS